MTLTLTASEVLVRAEAAPRLLFVVRGAEDYGTATKILGLFESLSTRGMTVTLFALGAGHLVDMARPLRGVTIHVDPTAPPRFVAGAAGKLRAFAATMHGSAAWMRRLRAFLAAGQFDAMALCEHGLVLPIGAVARAAGVPAFWIMANAVSGGYRFDLNRRLYAFAFRHLSVIPVANSAYTRGTLGRGATFAEKIDLGINPRRLATALSGQPREGIRLLVMARLVAGKGQSVLLEALRSRPAFADIQLILCGGPLDTPYARALQAQGAQLLGPVSDVAACYAMADVVVNARLDPEPFGLSVVEAMFAGKPVLAHAAGGPGDIVLDGITGWHIATPDVAAFAAGLSRMLDDRARWRAMGAAGRRRAEQRYTHDTMTDQFLRIVTTRLGR